MISKRGSASTGNVSGIVANGHARIMGDYLPSIQAEVEAQYAEAMRRAGAFRRVVLRWQIRREIRRRLEAVAPNGASFSMARRDTQEPAPPGGCVGVQGAVENQSGAGCD